MRSRNLLCLVVVALVDISYAEDKKPEPPTPLYDPDPQHLWNRLHAALWDRVGSDGTVYGHDRLDPLLWRGTHHLLVGPSRDAALKVLQEFLETHGEKLIDDPVKRAVLQRDLWAIFDWLAGPHENRMVLMTTDATLLRRPLAEAIGRLALDADAIKKLPDTYNAAVASKKFPTHYDPEARDTSFLPTGLFDSEKWVCLGRNGSDIIAPAHADSFSRSSFHVFLNLPAGRQATKDYLTELSNFKEPFRLEPLPDGRLVERPHPNLPQFPAGTQVAFVRSALLIDSEFQLRATRLVESVQLRVYHEVAWQYKYEFVLSRARLFSGMSGGLHAVAPEERDFVANFRVHSMDPIESTRNGAAWEIERHLDVVRQRCTSCHREPGVRSVRTFVGGFSPDRFPFSFHDADINHGESTAIHHKRARYDWGLLEGAGRRSAP